MSIEPYVETFDDGPGGWLGFVSNAKGPKALDIRDGSAISSNPWWVDYNHAPPGAGYLHILYMLHTRHNKVFHKGKFSRENLALGGTNRFVLGDHSTDFTNATVSVRLRGDLKKRGAGLHFLAIARVGDISSCNVFTGHDIPVTGDWLWQTFKLTPDPSKWTCLGTRHDRGETYGSVEAAEVLRDVNCDFMLILFPLNIVPLEAGIKDPHLLKAGEDYPVDTKKLPSGTVMMDEFRLEYANGV